MKHLALFFLLVGFALSGTAQINITKGVSTSGQYNDLSNGCCINLEIVYANSYGTPDIGVEHRLIDPNDPTAVPPIGVLGQFIHVVEVIVTDCDGNFITQVGPFGQHGIGGDVFCICDHEVSLSVRNSPSPSVIDVQWIELMEPCP